MREIAAQDLDRTLHDELKGYSEYAREVPYRLLPFLW